MRTWKWNLNPHSEFISDDNYVAKWSKQDDRYILFEPVNGVIVCMVDRKELIRYCEDNILNCYTYLLYLFERYIDKYNSEVMDGSDDKCIVKVKEDYNKCGNCKHLIFKDYRERTGACRLTRLYRRFEDLCVHDEDIM